ncbi:putative cyclin-D6-1 [Cornus florida]|uniref:putative cyclin-D6-1 n=1 Tax=Cornus florida TaxID=4283 RepID=UPI0028997388|nr:putative cyclin-D6-1 [Cornus florida]
MEFDLENPLPAFQDLYSDSFPSLFHTESDHMPRSLQATDFDISVRRQTISLISIFSHNFDPFLSYLAVNYLDRFLSTQRIPEGKSWVLRLLAVSCVSLALKMKETEFSAVQHEDGGFMFDKQTIRRMEFLILGALKWRMRSITPLSFINFFISLFKFIDPPSTKALKARATEIIFKAQHDVKLLEFKPSIIAATTLLYASHELFPLQFPSFRQAISNCAYVNKCKLFSCNNVMQYITRDGYESVLEMALSSSTPVNVLDGPCSSWSSDSEKTNSSGPTKRIMLERDTKRRKIGGFGNDGVFQLYQV